MRKNHSVSEEGWGRMKVTASIESATWQTSIWFDTKRKSYLLPVKLMIRKKHKMAIGSSFKVGVSID